MTVDRQKVNIFIIVPLHDGNGNVNDYYRSTNLFRFTFGQTVTDFINRMITIIKFNHIQSKLLRDIWNLVKLGQFDSINRLILLTVIPLSDAHFSSLMLIKIEILSNNSK